MCLLNLLCCPHNVHFGKKIITIHNPEDLCILWNIHGYLLCICPIHFLNNKKLCWWNCLYLLLQLTGGVILGVALWLRHDPKTSSLMGLEFDGAQVPTTFYISMYHICFHHFSWTLLTCFLPSGLACILLMLTQQSSLTCCTPLRLLWIINRVKCFNWRVRLHKLGLACHYYIALTKLKLYTTAGPHWILWVIINICWGFFLMAVNNW